jgi:eukaryotic-like serine/threonine-protein kinase
MNYQPNDMPYRRPAVVPIAFLTSLFTSLAVTVALLWLTGNLRSLKDAQSDSQKSGALREVPAVVGLSPEVAGDVLQARELLFVVSGEQADSEIPKGKIISQEPLPESELKAGSTVKVIVSTGVAQVSVPSVVGIPLDEAKQKLEAKGLAVGKVSETGEGDPGTVTAMQPKAGTSVKMGEEIELTAVPSGKPVPDVEKKYYHKAKKMLEEAGFKVGKITRRYNDNLDENVVLDQEPAAETLAPPGSEVNLVLND